MGCRTDVTFGERREGVLDAYRGSGLRDLGDHPVEVMNRPGVYRAGRARSGPGGGQWWIEGELAVLRRVDYGDVLRCGGVHGGRRLQQAA